jgi:hypothetical protein
MWEDGGFGRGLYVCDEGWAMILHFVFFLSLYSCGGWGFTLEWVRWWMVEMGMGMVMGMRGNTTGQEFKNMLNTR